MKKIFNLENPISAVILITSPALILTLLGVYFNIKWLVDTVPLLFAGISTLLVGSYAFTLYKKQKNDTKKDIANIILLEIQNAENVLQRATDFLAKTPPTLPTDSLTMPTENWDKNKYLFVADFDKNEWDAINNFYKICGLFDDAVKANGSYFQKNEEQVRVNIQRRAAELTKKYAKKIDKAQSEDEKIKLKTELRVKVSEEMDLYIGAVREYVPEKPIRDARQYLDSIKLNISLPGAITKLKELAKSQKYE